VSNVLTNELNNGFQSFIVQDSKPDRVLQCRDCSSVEIHNPTFFSLHGQTCKKGCGFGYTSEDLVPLPIKCKNCGNQVGFNFPDDSGVEAAELANHGMYAKGKASMLEMDATESEEVEDPSWNQFETSWTEVAKNSPKVKGNIEKQIFTIEPKDGFDSSGFVEKDMYHKSNIHETVYGMYVNAGNTPHMQKKIPIAQVLSIRNSQAKATSNAFLETKTYGDREINAECKTKMGFSIESDNHGNRKLSDQQIKRLLTSIYFAQDKISEIKEFEKPTKADIQELDKAEETVLRLTGVIKTGNASCGHQSPMYESRDNTYDPVSLEKLQMELDIPWEEPLMDIYALAKRVEFENNEAWRYNYVL